MGRDGGARRKGTELTKELLRLYLAGDQRAERELFESQRVALLELARRHRLMGALQASCSADDVVNEVFLRAISSGFLGRRFEDRGRGSLARALATILDRVMHDALRRQGAAKRRPKRVEEPRPGHGRDAEAEAAAAPGGATPTGEVRAAELIELCRQHLNEAEWQAWSLAEVDGLTAAEIGERLGRSGAAVRSLLFRARTKLEVALERSLGR